MLRFLRKHQKLFFVFITIIVVVSFCFFGTYSTMGQQEASVDRKMGMGMCGKPLMRREFTTLCRLLESSVFDPGSREPNLLNDGVIEKEFLSTGLAVMLAKPYFAELKGDLDERVKKVRTYRPYVHPSAKEVSAEWIWGIFSPGLIERYKTLKMHSDQATTESLSLLCQLYVAQAQMPPSHTLKQMLAMQQNQMQVAQDPFLSHADLSLFGFKSMQEWFGPRFVPLVASFILNVAQLAEERGMGIKTEEARADLLKNISQGYARINRNGALNPEEVLHYYQGKIRSWGLDEATVLHAWKKVQLFRRLSEEGGNSMLIDPLAYTQFEHFAKEGVNVEIYELPAAFQFASFLSMLKFQVYIEALAIDPAFLRKTGEIPREIASIETIQKRAPELVEKQVEVQWKEVSLDTLASTLSIKETWNWETKESSWKVLKGRFPQLKEIADLEHQEELARFEIDQFARRKMIEEQKELIRVALQKAPSKTAMLGLREGGSLWKKLGISENAELTALLSDASLKAEEENEPNRRLALYTEDKEKFYSIEVLSRGQQPHLLTYTEALKEGALDLLLDRVLGENRKKNSSQTSKEEKGKVVFADLLKAIERDYALEFSSLPGGNLPLTFYSDARLIRLASCFKKQLESSDGHIPCLREEPLFTREKRSVTRSTPTSFSKEELFSLQAEQFSPVKVGNRGYLAFYRVEGKEQKIPAPIASAEKGHQILSSDARRDMMVQLLRRIQERQAIDLKAYDASEGQ